MNCFKVKKVFHTVLCLLVAIIMTVSLSGCSSAAVKPSDEETRKVGNVGGYDVCYDELYFLINSYRVQLDAKYGTELSSDAAAGYEAELRDLVYKNIVANYAILSLCADAGLSLSDDELSDSVQQYIDTVIEDDFGGKRSDYLKSLEEYGLTDRYVRFTSGVDILYSSLRTEYLQTGVINDDEDYIRGYINNNFIRTWHIMIANDSTDSKEANYKKAQEALTKLDAGLSMYSLIKSYSEDFMMTTTDGYYFTHGSMDAAYEEAAFALDVGAHSGIIEATGTDRNGDSVDCYFIIERLTPENTYIEKNFETLKVAYQDALIYERLSEKKNSLAFEPNDYCRTLVFRTAQAPSKSVNVTAIVLWCAGGLTLAGAAVVAVVIIRRKKRAKTENTEKTQQVTQQ